MSQGALFDTNPPEVPLEKSSDGLPLRYADQVIVQPRCATCGARYSFYWTAHPRDPERHVCGDCLGLTFERVWGDHPSQGATA